MDIKGYPTIITLVNGSKYLLNQERSVKGLIQFIDHYKDNNNKQISSIPNLANIEKQRYEMNEIFNKAKSSLSMSQNTKASIKALKATNSLGSFILVVICLFGVGIFLLMVMMYFFHCFLNKLELCINWSKSPLEPLRWSPEPMGFKGLRNWRLIPVWMLRKMLNFFVRIN